MRPSRQAVGAGAMLIAALLFAGCAAASPDAAGGPSGEGWDPEASEEAPVAAAVTPDELCAVLIDLDPAGLYGAPLGEPEPIIDEFDPSEVTCRMRPADGTEMSVAGLTLKVVNDPDEAATVWLMRQTFAAELAEPAPSLGAQAFTASSDITDTVTAETLVDGRYAVLGVLFVPEGMPLPERDSLAADLRRSLETLGLL